MNARELMKSVEQVDARIRQGSQDPQSPEEETFHLAEYLLWNGDEAVALADIGPQQEAEWGSLARPGNYKPLLNLLDREELLPDLDPKSDLVQAREWAQQLCLNLFCHSRTLEGKRRVEEQP